MQTKIFFNTGNFLGPWFIILLLGPTYALADQTVDNVYLTELIRRSVEARLEKERYWQLLLHYRENTTGGYTSEIDDPNFFLAPNGKTDPQAELEATLNQFFSKLVVNQSMQPAQCLFVARYTWLKKKLSFDDRRLPPLPCERFETWVKELNAEDVTLIFSSAYMNNPASMFGHTLLRLDQKGQTEQTRLLAYTINYAAIVPADVGASYVLRGIGGGFKGYFSIIPYYLKVKEYGDVENRDIWEYRLRLTKEQIRRMLMHTWELSHAYFDYYFFKENCSYHLLSLLEIADPSLHLKDRFRFWTFPVEIVQLLNKQAGLVEAITYRPSRSTKIKRQLEYLSQYERGWFQRVIQEVSLINSESFNQFPPIRKATLLDLASDYFRYQTALDIDTEKKKAYQKAAQTILRARSAVKVRPFKLTINPLTSPPNKGHKPARIGFGVGWRQDEVFEELTIRAAYHDLLDPDPGYRPGAQVELLALSARHYEEQNQYRIEQFTLANIISLSPIDSVFAKPSWKISGGLQTFRFEDCRLCSNINLNGGIGAALETKWLRREIYFAFAELDANYSKGLENDHRIGGGGTVGVLANLTERWKILLSTTYLDYPLGDKSDDVRVFAGTRYTLQQNLALRFEFNHRHRDNQGVLALQAYY